ncbi:MAG: DUF4403 family protein [Myxococcota bacterium]
MIEVPMVLSLKALAANINRDMPAVLVEETKPLERGATMEMVVRRVGEAQLQSRSDGRLGITLPLQLDATVTARPPAPTRGLLGRVAEKLPPPPALKADINAGMMIDIALDIAVGEDWAMVPKATVSVSWTEEPVARLGKLSFDITKRVEAELDRKLPQITQNVEQKVSRKDNIHARISEAWQQLSTPRSLPADEDTWLAITPEAMFVTSPRARGEGLHLTAGMIGRIRTGIGDLPAPHTAPLPPNRPPPPGAKGLNLNLEVSLPWDALSTKATEKAQEQSWPVEIAGAEAGRLVLRSAEVYPSGDSIAIGLDYTATSAVWETEGTLWLTGQPSLDAEARVVHIKDFDYAVADWELNAAGVNSTVLREAIRDGLDSWMMLPFGEEVDAALQKANAQLASVQTRAGTLSANLSAIQPVAIRSSDEALVLDVLVEGEASMAMRPPRK